MIETKFKTVVTEHGVGIQASSNFSLRVNIEHLEGQKFWGIGFSLDALLARLASEGEAIERSTWHYGALWNSAVLNFDKVFLPEDSRLLLSNEEQKKISQLPALCYEAKSSTGERLAIPSQVLFFYPKRKQFGSQHSVTTGWAFHSSRGEALAQGYREAIERDLQMLFWHNRLSGYFCHIPQEKQKVWLKAYGEVSDKKSRLHLLQMPLKLHPSIHNEGYFTLAIQISEEPPYLTIGSAVKASDYSSFQTAMGEMIMLRSHQYEMILRSHKEENKFSYQSHVSHACYEPIARDRVKGLIAQLSEYLSKTIDYSDHAYQVVYLNPPPDTVDGVVAKVWVDKTQGMVPMGFKYKVCEHWQEVWSVTPLEWQENRWHPYP